jgi:hypothetical protein
MVRWVIASAVERTADSLKSDLAGLFGPRLESLAIYGPWVRPATASAAELPPAGTPLHALALVRALAFADLAGCAERAARWEALGLAMPLLLSREEFLSSLDAFPLEFGDIMARHVTIAGADPFEQSRVPSEDLRRACEVQAKSHLIHLREGFLEAGGRPDEVDRLIAESAPSFATLLTNLARLDGEEAPDAAALARYAHDRLGVSATLVERVLRTGRPRAGDETLQLYAPYHDAVSLIALRVDRWKDPART